MKKSNRFFNWGAVVLVVLTQLLFIACVSTPKEIKIAEVNSNAIKDIVLIKYTEPAEYRFNFRKVQGENGFVSSDTIGVSIKLERKAFIKYTVIVEEESFLYGPQKKEVFIEDIGYYPIPTADIINSDKVSFTNPLNVTLKQSDQEYTCTVKTLFTNPRYKSGFSKDTPIPESMASFEYSDWFTTLDIPFNNVLNLMRNQKDIAIYINGNLIYNIKYDEFKSIISILVKKELDSTMSALGGMLGAAFGVTKTSDQILEEARRKIALAEIIEDFKLIAATYEKISDYDNAVKYYKIANLDKEVFRVEEIRKLIVSGVKYFGENVFSETFKKLSNTGLLEKGAYYYLAGIKLLQYMGEKTAICVSINFADERSTSFIINTGIFSGEIFEYKQDLFGFTKGSSFIARYDGFVLGNPTFTAIIDLE
jgi:hypothetical protein